jgi:hypothetical protein
VAVDNVHDKARAPIFFIMDKISTLAKANNIRFILAARQPDYDRFIKEQLGSLQENHKNSLLKLNQTLTTKKLEPFSISDITEFIKRYHKDSVYFEDHPDQLEKYAKEIHVATGGHPIMVRFYVLGEGLRRDVEDRVSRYLDVHSEDASKKRQVAIICSLLHMATVFPDDEFLKGINLYSAALKLNHSILYRDNQDNWSTIHPIWAMEFFSYLFPIGEDSKDTRDEHSEDLENVLDEAFTRKDENKTTAIIEQMYNIARNKKTSVDFVDKIIRDHFPDYLNKHCLTYTEPLWYLLSLN